MRVNQQLWLQQCLGGPKGALLHVVFYLTRHEARHTMLRSWLLAKQIGGPHQPCNCRRRWGSSCLLHSRGWQQRPVQLGDGFCGSDATEDGALCARAEAEVAAGRQAQVGLCQAGVAQRVRLEGAGPALCTEVRRLCLALCAAGEATAEEPCLCYDLHNDV